MEKAGRFRNGSAFFCRSKEILKKSSRLGKSPRLLRKLFVLFMSLSLQILKPWTKKVDNNTVGLEEKGFGYINFINRYAEGYPTMVDYLIVGAGLAGSTCARLLAEKGQKVVIIEKRDHIAGNTFDYRNEHGLLVHKYGPHAFHTRHQSVWVFLSRFTDWQPYEHVVKVWIGGKFLSIPINVNTVNDLYGAHFTEANIQNEFFNRVRVNIPEISNAAEMVISKVGTELYELFFKNYTLKQWGIPAEALDKEVTARIPIRQNFDDRYFDDPWQGIPAQGYTTMVAKMLDHENISVILNTNWTDVKDKLDTRQIIYSGPIDEYFGFKYGKLGYRSLKFLWETHHQQYYQPVAQVNYPNDYDFTRITEFKHMTGEVSPVTTIAKEIPTDLGEPYYPIPMRSNREISAKYMQEAMNLPRVRFIGRLGLYKYANMDLVVKEAMELIEQIS